MPRARAIDPRNFGAKIGEDGRVAHDVVGLGTSFACSLFVSCQPAKSGATPQLAPNISAILSGMNRVWLARVLIVGQIQGLT
ncbi:hypothetical protein WBQ88_16610 [Sphingopyxis sp. CCNWLW253]|uniref:hypothetical protein n=1 Tax=unclassified Sphingopyxis TaxID=2614943 RepID=UPI003012FC8F